MGKTMTTNMSWIISRYKWFGGTAIITTEGGFKEARAFRTCMIPGLAITENGAGHWALTHERSGYGSPENQLFRVLECAISFAEKHARKIDWTRDREDTSQEEFELLAEELYFAVSAEEEALDELLNPCENDT